MTTTFRTTTVALALATLAFSGTAFAATHSDFSKSFPLAGIHTFAFKGQRRISRDPLANNDIWAGDVRQAVRTDLAARGMREDTNGNPDVYVAFYVGLRDRYDVSAIDYGVPLFHRGFRRSWWGWPRGYDVWAVPYTESTVIVDFIDAHTNQLVWRGYDTGTLNRRDPGRTLTHAVGNVVARFEHDAKRLEHVG
jgi:Domain of unknown function (DUF4136)